MGPYPVSFPECFHGQDSPFRLPRRKAFPCSHILDLKFRMIRKKRLDGLLVLLRGKGAGGIDHASSGLQHLRCMIQNLALPRRAHDHVIRAPLAAGFLVLTEHAFTGAWSVHHDFVEKLREALCQPLRRLIGHHRVPDSHSFHVLREYLRPGRMDLIAQQKAFSQQVSGDLSRLAARRRAEVQHTVSRLRLQKFHHCHSAGLLNVIQPRFMVRMLSRPVPRIVVIAFLRPRNLRQVKRGLR